MYVNYCYHGYYHVMPPQRPLFSHNKKVTVLSFQKDHYPVMLKEPLFCHSKKGHGPVIPKGLSFLSSQKGHTPVIPKGLFTYYLTCIIWTKGVVILEMYVIFKFCKICKEVINEFYYNLHISFSNIFHFHIRLI